MADYVNEKIEAVNSEIASIRERHTKQIEEIRANPELTETAKQTRIRDLSGEHDFTLQELRRKAGRTVHEQRRHLEHRSFMRPGGDQNVVYDHHLDRTTNAKDEAELKRLLFRAEILKDGLLRRAVGFAAYTRGMHTLAGTAMGDDADFAELNAFEEQYGSRRSTARKFEEQLHRSRSAAFDRV